MLLFKNHVVNEIPEIKSIYVNDCDDKNFHCLINSQIEFNLFDKFSCFNKLLRVTALIFRFYFNCKNQEKKQTKSLSCEEITFATNRLVQIIQRQNFKLEIDKLSKNQQIPNSSSVKTLNPFLDKENILRVGGRLRNSNCEFDTKHQILLPAKHHFNITT